MKKTLFIGLLAFLVASLWQLPISIVKPYIDKGVTNIKMEDVSGTIWNGESQHFTVNKQNLGRVTWHVSPIKSLSTLSLNTSFTIDGKDLTAKGIAQITPQKKLILTNTRFELDAAYANRLQKIAKVSGDVKGNIKHAVLDNKNLPEINGIIDWKEGAVNSPIKLSAGDYRAVITPNSTGLKIVLSSSDAPVELNGDIKLNKEWLFDTNLKIKAKEANLGSMLGLIGRKQPNGAVIIKQKGDLKPFLKK